MYVKANKVRAAYGILEGGLYLLQTLRPILNYDGDLKIGASV